MARILQGTATGIASGALSAAVVEAPPEARKQLGSNFASESPLAELAAGALLTGKAVRPTPHLVQYMFGVPAAVCRAVPRSDAACRC